MNTRHLAFIHVLLAAAALGFLASSATAARSASVVLFKNGAAFCAAYNWRSSDGFVGCSARRRLRDRWAFMRRA